jgi:hypothetical protein
MRDFKLPSGEIMLGRIRYFSDGMVIGSKQFLKAVGRFPVFVKFKFQFFIGSRNLRNTKQTKQTKQAVRECRVNTMFTPTLTRKPFVGANLVFARIVNSIVFSILGQAENT